MTFDDDDMHQVPCSVCGVFYDSLAKLQAFKVDNVWFCGYCYIERFGRGIYKPKKGL